MFLETVIVIRSFTLFVQFYFLPMVASMTKVAMVTGLYSLVTESVSMLLQAASPACFSHPVCCVWVSCFPLLIYEQCYNVPYLSLNMFLGGHQRDRDSATAYSKSYWTHSDSLLRTTRQTNC